LDRTVFAHTVPAAEVTQLPAELEEHNEWDWFFMTPSIATKFQYVNSLLFSFSLTACFGPYGPSSGEICNEIFLMDYFYYNVSLARTQFDVEMLQVVQRYFDL
jgi:hypothetical protein